MGNLHVSKGRRREKKLFSVLGTSLGLRKMEEETEFLPPFFELESAHLKVPSQCVSGMHMRALS